MVSGPAKSGRLPRYGPVPLDVGLWQERRHLHTDLFPLSRPERLQIRQQMLIGSLARSLQAEQSLPTGGALLAAFKRHQEPCRHLNDAQGSFPALCRQPA